MPIDRSKLQKGLQSYLANAEKSSGKTYDDMALVLSRSSLETHGALRSHLMERMGLGHGHANAIVHIWREFDPGPPAAAPVKAPARKAAKAPAKKAPANKAPARKPAANK